MDKPVENFWQKRLNDLKKELEANNYEVFVAESAAEAKEIVMENIIPAIKPKSISWGGSMTFIATGLYAALKNREDVEVLDTFDKKITPEQAYERRRQSLLADLFITGTNAVTESGQLVNLDATGNRVAAMIFGPKHVIVIAGVNKIVKNLDEALERINTIAAPINAKRLNRQTPCAVNGICTDCNSPERICRVTTIINKKPKRTNLTIVLVGEELGY